MIMCKGTLDGCAPTHCTLAYIGHSHGVVYEMKKKSYQQNYHMESTIVCRQTQVPCDGGLLVHVLPCGFMEHCALGNCAHLD